ncbi:hypothetical protein JHK85_041693 [Glycine max]|nr:hypothetical protein JHK85_041693 [Glycine max]
MEFNIPDSETQQNSRRRKKSTVWEHFTVKKDGPGCARAYCKRCQKSFAYLKDSKQSGTSHLKRHIALGICQKNLGILCSKTDANPPKKQARAKPCLAAISFDQERCNSKIAKMIILHDYPLHIVEHQGFIDFVRALQPQFNPLSFNAIQGDCVTMYLREKQNLLNLIDGIPGRVNLTLDLWTSNQTSAYVFLRGHFIDGDWNLHHPILNVFMVPFPDSDGSLNQTIVNCLSDWHLKGRLFTLALDKFFSNETLGKLRSLLSVNNPVILNGQLLSQNCYARVLSRLALDALSAMRESIDKVRESVKYVKSSKSIEGNFLNLRQQLQVPSTMDLLIDDQNKWDTIYHMLVAACELKEVFACFDASNPDFRTTLTLDDWKQVEKLSTNDDEGNEAMIKTEPFQEFDGSLFAADDGLSDFEFYISDFTCNQQFKTELDEYLEEPLEPRVQEFDILSWWRINGLKYPTLSRLASDILCMPISTLSADAVFDTEIRKMDSYRSSLDSLTLEALICTKDWLQSCTTRVVVEPHFQQRLFTKMQKARFVYTHDLC